MESFCRGLLIFVGSRRENISGKEPSNRHGSRHVLIPISKLGSNMDKSIRIGGLIVSVGLIFGVIFASVGSAEPQIEFLDLPYHEGDTVTIRRSCLSWGAVKMDFVARMDGSTIYSVQRDDEDQNLIYSGRESFVVPRSGILDVRMTCYNDVNQGWSDEESISVHPVLQGPGTSPTGEGMDAILIPLIIVVILLAIGSIFLIRARRRTEPPQYP